MTSQTLNTRITLLFESNKTTFQLVHRLAKLDFQPGSVPLEGEEGDVRKELSDEIKENLRQQEEDLELVRQEIEDLEAKYTGANRSRDSERERETSRLSIQVARLGEDLKHARSQFRQAQLQAKRSATVAKQKERELLFANIQEGRSTPTPGRKVGQDKYSKDDPEVYASNDVNASLRRMLQSMTGALEQSASAQDILVQDQARLAQLSEHYSFTDQLLTSSRTLLSSLVSSQKSDTWYLETAFWLLVTTIVWLVFRRFLYGPLWWLVWLPIKIWFRALSSVLAAIGLTKGSSVASPAAQLPTNTLVAHQSAIHQSLAIPSMAQAPNVPVGHDGPKEKIDDPSPQDSLSQQVGQMAEAAQPDQNKGEIGKKEETLLGGNGQPLEERKEPRNPKKRMLDTEIEAQKEAERQRDEL